MASGASADSPRLLRVPVSELKQGTLTLSDESARYVAKVHRKRAGDRLLLFDVLAGQEAEAVIEAAELPTVVVRVEPLRLSPRYEMPVALWAAVSKLDKPEQAVRDVTALGAESLVLFQAERSVAKGAGAARHDRLVRIAEQVARQCGRGRLPEIDGPRALEESLDRHPAAHRELRLMCVLDPDARPLLERLAPVDWEAQRVSIAVGPEGGFSPTEVEALSRAGFQSVDLGPYVLRAELACTAVLATLRAAWCAARLHDVSGFQAR